jgi:hypothetical protein
LFGRSRVVREWGKVIVNPSLMTLRRSYLSALTNSALQNEI